MTSFLPTTGYCLVLWLSGQWALAATNTQFLDAASLADNGKWLCEYCDFKSVFYREVEAGLGLISNRSDKFAEYNGYDEKKLYPLLQAQVRQLDPDASYVEAELRNLSLPSRRIRVETGQQGNYDLVLAYQEILHNVATNVATPYQETAADEQQLAQGWVSAGTTAGMSGLNGPLQALDIKSHRKSLSVGANYFVTQRWNTSLQFSHETRQGKKLSAGAFLLQSAQLAEPLDYVVNEITFKTSYVMPKWQFVAEYFASFFQNQIASLRWQNAYNPIVSGVDDGRLALPPSNRFHQLSVATAYQLGQWRLAGNAALGRVEQDDALVAITENSNLFQALPESQAMARLDTLNINLNGNAYISEKLTMNAYYRDNRRDNKTPSQWFDWVSSDVYGNMARRNMPYSFADKTLGFIGLYRFNPRFGFDTGFEAGAKERSHQAITHNAEDKLWGQVVFVDEISQIQLKYAQANRQASGFRSLNQVDPPENPLLLKYNMANRVRDTVSLRIAINAGRLLLDADYESAIDDYNQSILGLTDSREYSLNGNLQYTLSRKHSVHAFVAHQQITSTQLGSQSFGVADWKFHNADRINVLGVGWKIDLLIRVLSVGADLSISKSVGEITVETGAANPDFPDLKNYDRSLHAFAEYQLGKKLSFTINYWYEKFFSDDWMSDGLTLGSLPKVLNLQYQAPDYHIHLLLLGARYRF